MQSFLAMQQLSLHLVEDQNYEQCIFVKVEPATYPLKCTCEISFIGKKNSKFRFIL